MCSRLANVGVSSILLTCTQIALVLFTIGPAGRGLRMCKRHRNQGILHSTNRNTYKTYEFGCNLFSSTKTDDETHQRLFVYHQITLIFSGTSLNLHICIDAFASTKYFPQDTPMGYYNIDDILADDEKVPCVFNATYPGLGFLEGNPGRPLAKDTKVELPMWLAKLLAMSELLALSDLSFIELLTPGFISSKVLNAIHADPKSVDLHSLKASYYKLAEQWIYIFSDRQVAEVVMQLLKARALEIDNFASNTNKHVNSSFLLSLDEFEKTLFKVTAQSKRQMREWANEA